MSIRKSLPLAVVSVLLIAAPLLALDDPPLKNWAVPSNSAGKYSTLTDVGYPSIFVSYAPCRIVDTRGGAPLGGGVGPFTNGIARNYDLNSAAAPCTGIPAGVSGYSINITVTNTFNPGYIAVYPTGAPPSPLVSVLNYNTGQAVANATIVPCDSAGSITVLDGGGQADVIVDINGYFLGGGGSLNSNERLNVIGDANGLGMIKGTNSNTAGGYGILGETYALGGAAAGAYGWAGASSTTGVTYGVKGLLYGTYAGAAGVYGWANTSTAITTGVLGVIAHSVNDSAGVMGRDNTTLPAFTNIIGANGVRGESTYGGVVGVTGPSGRGVAGLALTSGGGLGQWGFLGGGSYGVYAYGNMGASGTKPFVEPHPYKAGTVIRYVALEGPEAGTYFRGRGRFENGRAVIDVPESFRLVTDEEGVTVQITPIGRFTQVAVTRIGLDAIEAQSSVKDVEFSYLVQGVRKNFKDWQVEVEGNEFMPLLPTSKIPAYLSEGQKQTLIRTGVYNEDGTVNMNTARRLGWDKVWESQKVTKAE